MARITYNNIQSAVNLITLTDVPNILTIDDGTGGSYATFIISLQGDLRGATSTNAQWYITLLGETINNVTDPQNAVNKNFYIATTNESTMASMVRAFRNCPNLNATFKIELKNGNVVFTARAAGSIFSTVQTPFSTNISSAYLTTQMSDGYASELNGAIINVDVYNDGEYITTLEKIMYDGECSFNMSPVLTTFSEVGYTKQYDFNINTIDTSGNYTTLGSVQNNHSTVGYMTNQGQKYLDNSYLNVAQNFSRGASRDLANNTILYTYFPSINLSVYKGNSAGATVTVNYLNSAYEIITAETITWNFGWQSSGLLYDEVINLGIGGGSIFNNAFYIDVIIGNGQPIRYNVIKPLRATEYGQRIFFRNSYGGISFIDFTGQRSEQHELETETYQKNIFEYYTDPMNELTKVYDNKVEYTVTLKSHLMEKDGIWIYNDLMQSPKVWTEINGETYAIIIKSVSVDETDRNDVYEATVTYEYSMEPSIL